MRANAEQIRVNRAGFIVRDRIFLSRFSIVPLDSLPLVPASAAQQRNIRIIASLPGRYWLADRSDARGESEQFACRAVSISPRAMALAAPVKGKIGTWVTAEIDRLGRLQGAVARVLHRGFLMSIVASDEERDRLAGRIAWIEKHKNFEARDQRAGERFMPQEPCSTLILPDGTQLQCFVFDASISGAAVSSGIPPVIGMVLAVGRVIGRVVRHFPGGFAVQFVSLQERDSIEAKLGRDWRDSRASHSFLQPSQPQ